MTTTTTTTTNGRVTFTRIDGARNDMRVSHQWATRPEDERFVSLTDMAFHFEHLRRISRDGVFTNRQIMAVPDADDPMHKGLLLQGPDGGKLDITHWSFGQLAKLGGAHASYLRRLPAPLAADCLNYNLKVEREPEAVGLLMARPDQDSRPILRAATGSRYGRIWNAEVVRKLVDIFGDGITGDYRVPGEFGKEIVVTKANTTLYASDHDMFVFLADEKNRIEIPNRRDGKTGSLAKGIYTWNSEVGDCKFGAGFFLFDHACCNRIVWGQQMYRGLSFAHYANAPDRFAEEVAPTLLAFAEQGVTSADEALLRAAQNRKVEDTNRFLRDRFSFSGARAEAIENTFQLDEGRPMESLWDLATGVTAYARSVPYQDQRVDLERAAGRIIDMAV